MSKNSQQNAPTLSEEQISAWRERIRKDTFAGYHIQMGIAITDNGDTPAAIDAFRRALAIDPSNTQALYRLREALSAAGRTEEAEAHHRAALDRDPDYVGRALCDMAGDAYVMGELGEALGLVRRAESLQPGFDRARHEAMLFASLLGGEDSPDLSESVGPVPDPYVAEKLANEYLKHANIQFGLAAQTNDDRLFGKGKRLLSRAFDYGPGIPEVCLAQSRFEIRDGRLKGALTLLRHASAVRGEEALPEYFHAFYGAALLLAGHLDEGVAQYRKRIDRLIEAHRPLAFSWLAYALLAHGETGEAEAFHRKAVAGAGQFGSVRDGLGLTLLAAGHLDEALAELNQAVLLAPQDPWIASSRGLALQALGRMDEALATQRHALALTDAEKTMWLPSKGWVLTNLALVLEAVGHSEEAIALHHRSTTDQPHTLAYNARLRPWATDRLLSLYQTLHVPFDQEFDFKLAVPTAQHA